MGNAIGCDCGNRQPPMTPRQRDLSKSFDDGFLRIIDYSTYFNEANDLKDLESVFESYIPYEITCVKDYSRDRKHSYVLVLGVSALYQERGVCLEIIYCNTGYIILCIWNAIKFRDRLSSSKLGIVELHCTFGEEEGGMGFKQFFQWLQFYKANPFLLESDEDENVGKLIYTLFRSKNV